jgi:hypothetical protein
MDRTTPGNLNSLKSLLIDAREAARLLCVSESALVWLTRTGGLPWIPNGRSFQYEPTDVRAWIEGRRTRQIGGA